MKADYVAGQNTVISSAQQSDEDKAALRRHVDEIIKGKAFRGSERSISFLKFVVEKAIAGEFDSLKERVIGVELFGRSPSYSTSKDAIVRVTASDVRRRLLQHYGWYGRASKFQISLPIRTYIPEDGYLLDEPCPKMLCFGRAEDPEIKVKQHLPARYRQSTDADKFRAAGYTITTPNVSAPNK